MTPCLKKLLWVACAAAIAAGLPAGSLSAAEAASQPASRPRKVNITVGRETTYLTGPLNPDGTVNYLAALNAIYGKGVTPANNAVVPLINRWTIPRPLGGPLPEKT